MKHPFLCLFLIFSFVLQSANVHADKSKKLERIERVHAIYQELVGLGRTYLEKMQNAKTKNERTATFNEIWAQRNKDINDILKDEQDIMVLTQIVMISKGYSYPSKAEHQLIDEVFYTVWGMGIARIENIGGEQAIDAIKAIRRNGFYDAGGSLTLREAIDRLEKKLEEKRQQKQ